jgi:outer membrane protein assembly factor BamB
MHTTTRSVLLLALTSGLLLVLALEGAAPAERAPGHWPQWRGAERNSISKEVGFLKSWPERGPALAWKATGLGEGVASVAVAGGRVFMLGKVGGDEQVTALEEATGKKLWSAAIGPAMPGESSLMRWLSQRTPTVDGERVYAITARGDLSCLKSADGTLVWRKNYPKDFAGKTGAWGWCDRPLVDGEKLICTPGGPKGGVVALDRKTGEIVWQCEVPGHTASYCAATVAEIAGVRQYVCFLSKGVVGVSAADGKLLWRNETVGNGTGNNYTPLVRGDQVLCASGYGVGMTLLKVTKEQDAFRTEVVWSKRMPLVAWHDGMIVVGNHIYLGAGRDLVCAELMTGKVEWSSGKDLGGAVSIAAAEGLLYLMSQRVEAGLVEATPTGYVLKGKFMVPEGVAKPGATAPVIAGGRLYLRDEDRVFCYEITEGAEVKPGTPEKPETPETPRAARPRAADEPDAVFVPTPQDVAERMVTLAGVRAGEVVVDLGCGDGRLVVTAARRHACRAIGYDLDPECVRLARANAGQHGVADRVRIEPRDIFTVDLSEADVVFLYLSPELNERLLPQLAKLKPGARVVSHAFGIPGVPADRVVTVPLAEDYVDHAVHVRTAPVRKVTK